MKSLDMLSTRLFLLAQFVTFWPVWRWYIERMIDGSDEPWGILALATVVILIVIRGKISPPTTTAVGVSSAVVAIYALSYGLLPPLFRSVLAVIVLSITLSSICYGRTMHAGVFGLILVSLPLIASLQFYGGFPIRFVTAFVSSQILGLIGYEVQPQGTLLHWMGEVIAVDAPCAGIKMLWTGLYLNFTLALWRNLGFVATWLSTSFTLFSVFLGNIVRATLLFFTESGIIKAPDFAHQAIGVLIFVIVTLVVLSFHRLSRETTPCVI
ncbi:MAG: archaeosortase/exosortase family protein [Methylococcales bacterium]